MNNNDHESAKIAQDILSVLEGQVQNLNIDTMKLDPFYTE